VHSKRRDYLEDPPSNIFAPQPTLGLGLPEQGRAALWERISTAAQAGALPLAEGGPAAGF